MPQRPTNHPTQATGTEGGILFFPSSDGTRAGLGTAISNFIGTGATAALTSGASSLYQIAIANWSYDSGTTQERTDNACGLMQVAISNPVPTAELTGHYDKSNPYWQTPYNLIDGTFAWIALSIAGYGSGTFHGFIGPAQLSGIKAGKDYGKTATFSCNAAFITIPGGSGNLVGVTYCPITTTAGYSPEIGGDGTAFN